MFTVLSIGPVDFYFMGCFFVFLIFIQHCNKPFCKETVEALIRRHVLRRLISSLQCFSVLSDILYKNELCIPFEKGSNVLSTGEVSTGAKIRSRYNQVPHPTQDTNWKVKKSQLDTTNQEVSPFLADLKMH